MLIGFTGRIAAGKGVLIDFLKEKGFSYYSHSNEVRKETKKRGLKLERSVLQDVGNSLRKEQGASAWTLRLIKKINKDSPKNAVIDAIRNPSEIIELKKHFKDFILISINAPQETRFKRAIKRNKNSDPKTWKEFIKIDSRDLKEKHSLGQQVGKCMELADYSIKNDSTIKELERKFQKIMNVLGI